jgi:hypothetical protein
MGTRSSALGTLRRPPAQAGDLHAALRARSEAATKIQVQMGGAQAARVPKCKSNPTGCNSRRRRVSRRGAPAGTGHTAAQTRRACAAALSGGDWRTHHAVPLGPSVDPRHWSQPRAQPVSQKRGGQPTVKHLPRVSSRGGSSRGRGGGLHLKRASCTPKQTTPPPACHTASGHKLKPYCVRPAELAAAMSGDGDLPPLLHRQLCCIGRVLRDLGLQTEQDGKASGLVGPGTRAKGAI